MIGFLSRQKRKQVRVDQKPRTGGYRPTLPAAYFEQPRDLPLFSFSTIRHMLTDGMVRLSLAMRSAPMGQVQWQVESTRDEVAAYVQRQLDRIWQNHLTAILQAQVWSWSAGEITLRLSDGNLVEIDALEARQARDCRLMIAGGEPVGVQVEGVRGDGKVDLKFPNAWFHAHEPEEGEFYGRSVLRGAYSPWFDKTCRGGAVDVRRLFMHKDAYGGVDLGYPEGYSDVLDETGEPIPYRDIAVQIVEQLRAGGVTTRPSTVDEHGNEKWPLTRASVPANPQHILQYPKDLDSEIRRGIGIPDDIIDSDSSGAWAGKRVPMGAFYASLDGWARGVAGDFREQVFDPLVLLNFGSAVDYEITHKPLAEQAMEQQSNAGGAEGGPPGESPPPQPGQSHRMSLDPVDAVGRGVLDAGRIVEAARSVLRMGNVDDDGNEHAADGKFTSKGQGRPGQRKLSGTHPTVKDLVRDAIAKKTRGGDQWIDYSHVSTDQADRIRESTGLDVTGYVHQMQDSDILHAIGRHGIEEGGQQVPITAEDFEKVPEIVSNPDTITLAGKTRDGKDVIRYEKRDNGTTYVAEEVRSGRRKLAFKSMWKHPTKKTEE
ncbi:MAG: hypothetical protein ACF788_10815 [Novipirellula sp. JB048]